MDGGGAFLRAARLLGRTAERAGFFAQALTPAWPQPPGSPDRAFARLSPAPILDLNAPWRFHLEVVSDPTLAVIPPMGNALLPGGRLLVNSPSSPASPDGGPRVHWADFSALAALHRGELAAGLAAGACAILGTIAPEMPLGIHLIEALLAEGGEGLAGPASLALARASFVAAQSARPAAPPGPARGGMEN